MKIMFLSDIHGSIKFLEKAMERFELEKAEKLVLLGDYMYHGPRNNLPDGYDTREVAELLNKYKEKIVAVRGNCDSEVDQMLLEFPIMSDYAEIVLADRKIFATHGHIFNKDRMPLLNKGDIFVHGHFHIPMAEIFNEVYYLNPGSISIPRGESTNGYAIFENGVYYAKDITGKVVKEIKII